VIDRHDTSQHAGLSRRGFLGAAGTAAVVATALGGSAASASASTRPGRASERSGPQLAVSGAGLVGATVLPAGSNTRGHQAQIFDGYVGRPLAETVQKVYFTTGQFPVKSTDPGYSDVASLASVGCQVILCYKPSIEGSDLNSLIGSIEALQAITTPSGSSCVHAVVLWNEPQYESGITLPQYLAEVQKQYGPFVRAHTNLYYCASPNQKLDIPGDTTGGVTPYFPGGQYVDVTAIDLYANQYYSQGFDLGPIQDCADSSPATPLGILEFGVTNDGENVPSDIQVLAYFDYLLSTMSARLASVPNQFNGPVCYYEDASNSTGVNNITSANDYRVSTLQAMFDTLSKNSTVLG
jgi:hypothetical protein